MYNVREEFFRLRNISVITSDLPKERKRIALQHENHKPQTFVI